MKETIMTLMQCNRAKVSIIYIGPKLLPKPKTFIHYADPSHGWVKVPKALLRELNVRPAHYSYQRGEFFYLEEDGDLRNFMEAYREANGFYPQIKTRHTNKQSKIRNYERASND